MNTLEYKILVIINRDHPLASEEIRIKLGVVCKIDRTKRRIQQVLKSLSESGKLKRIWVEPTSENRGKWLYSLPEQVEPMKKLPDFSKDTIVRSMRRTHKKVKHFFCCDGKACEEKNP